ncbi:MAG: helix-turn-helix domain-containing protein [Candidatus Dojkabacteria bacterium]|jgi:cytoskeletal protein RodZ|nr:helix-turn-helix domain-containing protein [Candidatus Dojkabacteria bacterium]MDD4560931.1 helix-turn-helix domain-containing protein [Candidatus Dojkabacteria bacterium]
MITAGEVLKNKRESLGKPLDQVSSDTKIQKRFLEYIEQDKFSYFDSEVFLTGFIKIYAKYLGLDINKILALYRRSNPSVQRELIKKEEKESKGKNIVGKKQLSFKTLDPKTLVTFILSTFLLLIIGYIGLQIYKFQTPPEITILEPLDGAEVNEESVTVKGEVDNNTVIEINDKPVETNDDGSFEKEIELKEGSNLITVRAKKNKNNTLEAVETIHIKYIIKGKEENGEEEEESNKLTLEITDSPAWIRLDLDNENKLSQVVEPSKSEYVFFDNLYIITGRVSSTKIYWNNNIVEWKPTQKTGVAELECRIVEQDLICD